MRVDPNPSARIDARRTIAAARVVLACAALLAVWLDPAEPARYARVTYGLNVVYVLYAFSLALLVWRRVPGWPGPLLTHAIDIAAFSVLQFLTLGPSSPFFIFFVFSLFCGAIRWGWRGALWTAGVVVVMFVTMTAWMSRTLGPDEFQLNRTIVRAVYLVVVAGLLVYLGRYEERLRDEIERLARWPSPGAVDLPRATERILEHGARIMDALRALIVWEAGDEPRVMVGTWSPAGFRLTMHAPTEVTAIVPPPLERATFVCPGAVTDGAPVLVRDSGAVRAGTGTLSLPRVLEPMRNTIGLASAPFETERVSGRVFFGGLGASTAEVVPLAEIVAREIGNSLDRLHLSRQLAEIAASEERIKVARDLHDGVLQSLTGIRLEIRSVGEALTAPAAEERDRLFAIERALAIEQRELRLFINELGPARTTAAAGTLAGRLHELRNRIALEWKAPVEIRVTPANPSLPEGIAEAVPPMVHEAVVNALKHAEPSRVVVSVDVTPGEVRIAVSDDGHGFRFRGRFDQTALATMSGAPTSLLARVVSMGAEMSIESSENGSRVEMTLPLEGVESA